MSSDEITLSGKQYVSSKRAAELSGYSRDYVGQLARAGLIDAERVGGLWYISMDSLRAYESEAEEAKQENQKALAEQTKTDDSLVSFEGKDYISSIRASQTTGYNQDYVGQLARAATIPSRQVGKRWFVERESLLAHKAEKDALLAAVQTESVGLGHQAKQPDLEAFRESSAKLTYTTESSQAVPELNKYYYDEDDIKVKASSSMASGAEEGPGVSREYVSEVLPSQEPMLHLPPRPLRLAQKRAGGRSAMPLTAAALTIVVVLALGYTSMKSNSLYAIGGILQGNGSATGNLTASVGATLSSFGDMIEEWLVPELVYIRAENQ